MKSPLIPVILMLAFTALVCCAAETSVLTPEPGRITDQAISADIATITALQQRLAVINSQGTPIASYHFAKAQAWLDMARDEYVMNDRTRVVQDALCQAGQLIEQLESKKNAMSMDTEILPTSKMIRPDLWRQAVALKKSPGFSCGEDLVARLEVQLVWAGHEDNQLGWRNAKPYLLAAERLAGEAERKIEACPASQLASALKSIQSQDRKTEFIKTGAEITVKPVSSSPVPVDTTSCSNSPAEKSSAVSEPVPDRIHFAVNSDTLGSRSAAVLERLAVVLRHSPDVNVELQGHADERGSEAFNRTLSMRRAEVVKAYLVAAGIAQGRITLKSFGGTIPATSGKDSDSYARNRRVMFAFSVGNDQLLPFVQVEDLRIEKSGLTTDK